MEAKKLKRYGIYHPKDGFINKMCKIDVCDYNYIASIEAENLIRAVYSAQAHLNPAYADIGARNTSVGDIVVHEDKVYMFRGTSFKRVPRTKDTYKKVMETDEAVVEILSRTKLTDEDINDLLENCI